MIQEILTYVTVAAAVAYALRGAWRIIFAVPGKQACSGGCSSGCEAKSFLLEAAKKKREAE
jgi:hypothetical protein